MTAAWAAKIRLPADLVRPVLIGIGAFVVSRVCVLAAAATRAAQFTNDWNHRTILIEAGDLPPSAQSIEPDTTTLSGPFRLMTDVFTSWDSEWYLRIMRSGYPASIPPDVTFHDMEARAAFFPGFPLLARWVDAVLPGGDVLASLAVNTGLSLVALVLLGVLARRWFDVTTATRAMVLFALFPGSFVLSYIYSEPLFIAVSLATLLMLDDERWVAAGVFAAIGTATRPNGLALIAACAVASFIAIRRRRDWGSLVAPLLAPIGIGAFHLYLGFHTGEWLAWFRVQGEAWDEGTSFGGTAVTHMFDFVKYLNPLSSGAGDPWVNMITAITLLCMLFMLWCLWRRPLPWPAIAFIAVILAMMLIPDTVTARPRFLFTAAPLFIPVAAWWPRRDRYGWEATLVGCGAGLVVVTSLYASFSVIP